MRELSPRKRTILTGAKRALGSLLLAALAPVSIAQVWTPLTSGTRPRSVEVLQSSSFAVPPAILAKGGNLRVLLVAGGEGGSAARSSCEDPAVQGGRGGDGGEVVEVDIPVAPGQCAAGFTILIGDRGRGAFRAGNSGATGELGGSTSIACGGTMLALALGGGRRPDAVTAARAAHGGTGGVVMNAVEANAAGTALPQVVAVRPGAEGQTGHQGYGSGGGGGGATLVSAAGTVRNAPLGSGGYGAGAGAGPAGYAAATSALPAQNAIQYGAGGGGGYLACGAVPAWSRDAGHGAHGLARIVWYE